MPTLRQLPGNLRKLLFGVPFGEKFPPEPNPPFLPKDGRTVALELLGEYVCALRFFRPNAPGQPPISFEVAADHFYVDWPESVQVLRTAEVSCAVIPGKVTYENIGLGNFVLEETKDKYLRGTVAMWMGCHVEQFQLEFWCANAPQARAIKAGMEVALSPVEQMAGIRFAMPAYFGQLVTFWLDGAQVIADEQGGRGRRRVRFDVAMRYNTTQLVNYVNMVPQVAATVDSDEQTGTPVAQVAVTYPGPK